MPRFMSSVASSSSGRAEQPAAAAAASELAPYIESNAVPPANTCASRKIALDKKTNAGSEYNSWKPKQAVQH